MLKGKNVQVSAILRHTEELGWLKEVLKRVSAMRRLFRESLGLSDRKVGSGMSDFIQKVSPSVSSVTSVPRVKLALPPDARRT